MIALPPNDLELSGAPLLARPPERRVRRLLGDLSRKERRYPKAPRWKRQPFGLIWEACEIEGRIAEHLPAAFDDRSNVRKGMRYNFAAMKLVRRGLR